MYVFNRLGWETNSSTIGMSIEIEPPVSTAMIIKIGNLNGITRPAMADLFLKSFGSHSKYSMELLMIAENHYHTCEKLFRGRLFNESNLYSWMHSKSLYKV